jgi:hypothetical protein
MRWLLCFAAGYSLACTADPSGGGTSFGTSNPATGDDDGGTTAPVGSSDDSTTSGAVGSTGGSSTGGDTTAGDTTEGVGCADLMIYFADADSDGFGDPDVSMEACEAPEGFVLDDGDCDDQLMIVNPAADELCDGFDNDCDGLRDEHSAANTTCEMCTLAARNDSVYWFCPGPVNRFAARDFCVAHGGDLTSIADLPEDGFVRGLVAGPRDWFIGLEDLVTEGIYEWSDGSATDYLAWAPGEPNNVDNENCVELALEDNWSWNDTNCENEQAFICEALSTSTR